MPVAEQIDIFSQPSVAVAQRPRTPQQKWERFIADNPGAPDEICHTAAQLLGQGHRATIAVVWEELRYRVHTHGDPYRWDNSLRAPAADWMRRAVPHLAVHMRTRKDRR